MKTPASSADETPCETLLRSYIDNIEENIIPWYERHAHVQYDKWFFWFRVSIIAGFASSVMAALVKMTPALSEWGGYALIILPLIGSFANIYLNQFHYRQLEDIRERGRIEAENIYDWAQGQLAAAKGEPACHAIYEELTEKIRKLELWQHKEFTVITGHETSSKAGAK